MVDAALAALLGMMAGALWAAVALVMRTIWQGPSAASTRADTVSSRSSPSVHRPLSSRCGGGRMPRPRDMAARTAL